jgi:hypothetical protein
MINYYKLRGLSTKISDLNRFTICFSTGNCVSRVHGPVDRYSGRSTVDSRPGRGGALAGVGRAAATEGGSSPQKHLETEGAEGNLTATLVGAEAAWFGRATARQKRWWTELGGRAIRVRMEQADARNGKVVWRRCSRVPFIGWGRRKGGGQGVIRRRLGGA